MSTEACSFCGLNRINRKPLVVGISAAICDHCIGLCNEVVAEGKSAQRSQCSFCERSNAPVVHGPGIAICEDCLDEINRDVYIRRPAGIDI